MVEAVGRVGERVATQSVQGVSPSNNTVLALWVSHSTSIPTQFCALKSVYTSRS